MKRGTHIRIERELREKIRKAFPNVKSDSDRVATLYDNHERINKTINGLGKMLYGGKLWKKIKR